MILLAVIVGLASPAAAAEYTAPIPSDEALELIPDTTQSFGSDLWQVLIAATAKLQPEVYGCAKVCVCVFCVVMLTGLLKAVPGKASQMSELMGVVAVAAVLLRTTNSLIALAAQTVTELSEYGKLLLPVMTAALAGQGALTASASLYTATALLNTLLSSAMESVLVPMVYIFLALTLGAAATGEQALKSLRDSVKWLCTWSLKTILYVFTGYMSITGVVSGTTDAAALKATKLTISGMVPVIGGILSDASEAVIVSAGLVKNSVGIYGLIAVIAIWIGPFLSIGVQYLILKLTAGICTVFDVKPLNELIGGFTAAMGLLLAMVGTACVLLLISTVCFMKGAS